MMTVTIVVAINSDGDWEVSGSSRCSFPQSIGHALSNLPSVKKLPTSVHRVLVLLPDLPKTETETASTSTEATATAEAIDVVSFVIEEGP